MDRRTLLATLASGAAVAASPFAHAQEYPAQLIKWVVPYPAGGGTDVIARVLAESMRQTLGQQIVVDNRPGASTNIGADLVAKSKPDGYTVLSADNAVLAFNEHLFSKLPFNPEKDFTYIGAIGKFPLALVVHPDFPAKTFKEFLAYVKANPGKVNYASPGNGSPHHLAMEMFKVRTGTFITHIPYRGAAPAMADVMGGQVPCMFLDLASGLSIMQSQQGARAGHRLGRAQQAAAQCADAGRSGRAQHRGVRVPGHPGPGRPVRRGGEQAQRRPEQGLRHARRAEALRRFRHGSDARHAGAVRGAVARGVEPLGSDHQAGRHQAGLTP
jgi:tripartite-type tricarboxylate transporter receptor subunit TctC